MSSTKFKVPEVKKIVNAVIHMQQIADEKGDKGGKYITDRCNTIARNIHKELDIIVDNKTGKLTSEPEISFRYYTQLMERYRNAIKDLGYKHHAIEKHLHAFVDKYSDKVNELDEMLNPELPLSKLRENFIKLRAKATSGSSYKSDLLKIKFEHHLFYSLDPKGAIKDWRRDDDKKSLNEKLNSVIKVNPDYIYKVVNDIFNDKNASTTNLAIALTLSTGRRATEIMKTAKFKVISDKTLLFSGQLKTKNREIFEIVKAYEIPCLVDANLVAKGLRKLRRATGKDIVKYKDVRGYDVESTVKKGDIKDYDHNRAVGKKYESTLNRGVRVLLEEAQLSISSCRALYTEITYDEHALPGETRTAFRHRVYGHSLIETQQHYDRYKISRDIDKLEVESKGEDKKSNENLLNYISKADAKVKQNTRAKAMHRVHDWLKGEVAGGLQLESITATFIRRNCLIDGKQINLNTIKTYLNEYVQIGAYKEPEKKKKKPDNKTEARLLELREKLEQLTSNSDGLREEIVESEYEIENLEEDLEIKREEKEEKEREHSLLIEEIYEIEEKITSIENESNKG